MTCPLFRCMQMRNLCEALSPALRSIRQQEYYANPKFHASIGWALLHQAIQKRTLPTESPGPPSTPTDPAKIANERKVSSPELLRVSCLPQEMIAALNGKYSVKLSSLNDGVFLVEAVTLKIGKENFAWKFPSCHKPQV